MTRMLVVLAVGVGVTTLTLAGQSSPTTHRLEATPATVAYGY